MKKIVIIGANEFQNPLIRKAKEMGYETHVFAWKDGAIGEKTADYFYPISIVEKEKILEECKKIKPDAIATIASDLAGITVHYLAKNSGLVCNSERNIKISTNKYEMRKALKEADIPTPDFYEIDADTDLEQMKKMQFPVIVKPTDRSGSRGITKLETFQGIEQAVSDAIENSFEKKAIIEEYIDGMEYSCECISFDGEHHFLAVTKKFTTGAPHFIETGHLEPSGLDDAILENVKHHIFHALNALEIRYGASHSEFKIDQSGNIRIIEIGARMGGDCIGSDLVQISTGYDFLKMTIQAASGEKPDLIRYTAPRFAAVKFIFTAQDYAHLKDIQTKFPEKIYFVSEINMKTENKIIDSSSRYGFYILTCDTMEEAIKLAGFSVDHEIIPK
ncbi:MAG: ATP-grasp domain-containing protein [Lachnospiraceae bacterium]|nr:ATP-grasp domain-containing protein [Lachnospiraceae bacterium]MCM1233792.1 ATP-grasp domain-containing protein [Ruminococcus flavefaciens]